MNDLTTALETGREDSPLLSELCRSAGEDGDNGVSGSQGSGTHQGRHKCPVAAARASLEANLAWTAANTTLFPKGTSRGDAIRRKCLDCAAGSVGEVRACRITSCALWPFRLGDDPFRRERQQQAWEDAGGGE